MNCKKPVLAALSGAAALALSSSAFATTLLQMSFDEIAEAASDCVVAQAMGSETVKVDGQVMTRTEFAVKKTAFGDAPATIAVMTPGGRYNNGKISVSEVHAGSPVFLAGTQSMLFLNDSGSNEYSIVGYMQGVYTVNETPEGAAVQLPSSAGGPVAIDDALAIARDARN